jgi:hypothetical protein
MDSEKPSLARIIQFGIHEDLFGAMIIADAQLPFKPQRNIWIYEMSEGRGTKAQRKCEQIYVVLQGAITVNVFDGSWNPFKLNNPYEGLYLPKMTWRHISDIAFGTILLVMCSLPYDPEDRIDDFDYILRYWMDSNIAKGLKFSDEVS